MPTMISRDEVTDLLDKLVSKSLIVFDETTHRYHALEMVRQYARESQVADVDKGALQMHERHASYFLDLLSKEEHKRSAGSLTRIGNDYENVRIAFEWWAASDKHVDKALEMAFALYPFWYARGMLAEGAAKIEGALNEWLSPKDEVYGRALWAFGDLAMHCGRHAEAKAAFEQVRAIALSTKDTKLEALAYGGLAGLHQDYIVDFEESQANRKKALAISEELGDQGMVARNLYNLGDLILMQHPDTKNPDKMGSVTDRADEYFRRAQALIDPKIDTKIAIFNRGGLGRVALRRKEFALAREHFAVCMEVSIDAGYLLGQSMSCYLLGLLAYAEEDLPRAVKCLSKALEIALKHGYEPGARDQEVWRETMEDISKRFPPEEIERLQQEGARMSPSDLLNTIPEA